MNQRTLVMGAVAYAPKVVTIWEGFKQWFHEHGLGFDFVLYSNYERQVEDQFNGTLDVAWNSPLAWVRVERIARAKGMKVSAVAMRDTDCDLTSVLVVRSNAGVVDVGSLRGNRLRRDRFAAGDVNTDGSSAPGRPRREPGLHRAALRCPRRQTW